MSKNLVIVTGSLRGGGAERVAANLANHFATKPGCKVTIVLFVEGSAYALDERVQARPLFRKADIRTDVANKIWRRLAFPVLFLKALAEAKPDVVISFLQGTNLRTIFACKLLGQRVIATEHLNHLADQGPSTWFERRIVYKLADALTVLTKFDLAYYARFLETVRLIPNPLSFAPLGQRAPREKRILAAGALNRWKMKGFDNLLRVFAAVSPKHPDWRLVIAGQGDEGRRVLESLARELGIEDRVDFLGFVPDLDREMRRSEIFALSSRYEGFSMVLLEAMSQGCACVSFDCVAGPGEILANEVTGLVAEDQNCAALEAALVRLIESPELRQRLAEQGCEASKEYLPPAIAARWENLLWPAD